MYEDGGPAGGAAGPVAEGLFVEPALRLGFMSGPVEVQTQAGLSLRVGGDLLDRHATVPLFFGGTAALSLGG